MKLPGETYYALEGPEVSFGGKWFYKTRVIPKEKEVLVIEPAKLEMFLDQCMCAKYEEGFKDALKTVPLKQVKDKCWEIKS